MALMDAMRYIRLSLMYRSLAERFMSLANDLGDRDRAVRNFVRHMRLYRKAEIFENEARKAILDTLPAFIRAAVGGTRPDLSCQSWLYLLYKMKRPVEWQGYRPEDLPPVSEVLTDEEKEQFRQSMRAVGASDEDVDRMLDPDPEPDPGRDPYESYDIMEDLGFYIVLEDMFDRMYISEPFDWGLMFTDEMPEEVKAFLDMMSSDNDDNDDNEENDHK